jgi:hypothetical protein
MFGSTALLHRYRCQAFSSELRAQCLVFLLLQCVESRNSEVVWVEACHRSNIVILVFTYLDFHVRSDPIRSI